MTNFHTFTTQIVWVYHNFTFSCDRLICLFVNKNVPLFRGSVPKTSKWNIPLRTGLCPYIRANIPFPISSQDRFSVLVERRNKKKREDTRKDNRLWWNYDSIFVWPMKTKLKMTNVWPYDGCDQTSEASRRINRDLWIWMDKRRIETDVFRNQCDTLEFLWVSSVVPVTLALVLQISLLWYKQRCM